MDLFLAVLVIVLGIAVIGTGFFLFIKLRPRFPSLVNCWFCNVNTKVPYDRRNEWTCPVCEQYNGFTSDGDYNKSIPAQYDVRMNQLATTSRSPNYKKPTASKFCRSCTINQQLKIQQLASFVPIDEDNFDEEIEQYRVHLERAYALCPSCEGVLKDTLTRQKAWLFRLQAKEKGNSHLKGKRVYGRLLAAASSMVQLARALSASICTIMLASVLANGGYLQIPPSLVAWSLLPHPLPASEPLVEWLLFIHRSVALAVAGILFQLVAATSCLGKNWNRHDVCGIAGWTFLLLQYWAALSLPLKDYIRAENTDCIHVLTLLATLTFSLLPFLMRTISKSTLKKIQSDSIKRLDTSVDTASEKQASGVSENTNGSSNLNCSKDSSYFTNKCSPQLDTQKKMCDETTFRFTDNRRNCKTSSNDACANTNTSGPYSHFHRAKCYSTDPYFEQDLHHSLCSLSLGTSTRPRSRRWAFESRVYGGKEFPGLFTATDNRPRPLLSPPRLGVPRNVTRSPWSAGGYWQTPASFVVGHDGSPLSRSSSRSSGFGSLSSRAAAAAASPPGSRAGSVCAGDADRFSVHSLPAYPPNFAPTYFPFYGGPYLMPHLGGYTVAHPYCFAPSPASASPQSSPALSDSDSSCASQKGTKCRNEHKGFIHTLKENSWLSFVIGSSLFLNAVATVFFILTNRNVFAGVP